MKSTHCTVKLCLNSVKKGEARNVTSIKFNLLLLPVVIVTNLTAKLTCCINILSISTNCDSDKSQNNWQILVSVLAGSVVIAFVDRGI